MRVNKTWQLLVYTQNSTENKDLEHSKSCFNLFFPVTGITVPHKPNLSCFKFYVHIDDKILKSCRKSKVESILIWRQARFLTLNNTAHKRK